MNAAKKHLVTLDPNSTMARAYLIMEKLSCHALPVASEGEIVGVLTLSDIEALVDTYTRGAPPPRGLTVGNYMRGPVRPVDSTNDISAVIRSMIENKTQAVVVKQGDDILGILSKDNLLEILARLTEKSKATVMDSLRSLANT